VNEVQPATRAGERQVFFIAADPAHLFDENGDAIVVARQVSFH
jgi:hypothetical protein